MKNLENMAFRNNCFNWHWKTQTVWRQASSNTTNPHNQCLADITQKRTLMHKQDWVR